METFSSQNLTENYPKLPQNRQTIWFWPTQGVSGTIWMNMEFSMLFDCNGVLLLISMFNHYSINVENLFEEYKFKIEAALKIRNRENDTQT